MIEWAILASIVAVVSPVLYAIVKSTTVWSRLDSAVNNLSKVVKELSCIIKEIQVLQGDMIQRIAKEEATTETLQHRVTRVEERVDKLSGG